MRERNREVETEGPGRERAIRDIGPVGLREICREKGVAKVRCCSMRGERQSFRGRKESRCNVNKLLRTPLRDSPSFSVSLLNPMRFCPTAPKTLSLSTFDPPAISPSSSARSLVTISACTVSTTKEDDVVWDEHDVKYARRGSALTPDTAANAR